MTKPICSAVPGPKARVSRRRTVAFAVRHPLVRAGAVCAATSEHRFRVVESVESVEALDGAEPADLTVVEVDPLGLPPCAARITALAAVSKVVLLAAPNDPATRRLAAETGVHLVVEHDAEITDLVSALLQLAGTTRCGDESGRTPVEERSPLSRRETETMRHIGDGLTYRQIARRMGLSEATVGTYARRIRKKLNAPTKVQMVVNAMEFGYVAGPGARAHRDVPPGPRNEDSAEFTRSDAQPLKYRRWCG